MYALNQDPIYGTLSSTARIHGSRNQGVEVEVAPLTITPSDPLANFLLPFPTTLHSTGLEVLAPEGGTLPPGETTMILFNWKLRFPPGHFGLLLPLNQQDKKRVTVLAGVIDLDYQDEISLLFHNGGILRMLIPITAFFLNVCETGTSSKFLSSLSLSWPLPPSPFLSLPPSLSPYLLAFMCKIPICLIF
uniref:dUTPase-like domain-containing protein n=1 Tax=Papio anubis TaxID=9555 RepID=A0A8I5R0N4_PAPAN